MVGRELEVIGTDRNYVGKTVRYFMDNGHYYTDEEIRWMILGGALSLSTLMAEELHWEPNILKTIPRANQMEISDAL